MENANAVGRRMQTICLHAHYYRLSAERKILSQQKKFKQGNTNCCLLGREGNMKTNTISQYQKQSSYNDVIGLIKIE